MSYDINMINPDTGKVLCFEEPHDLRGGTYAMGGTTEAWLNVTYNYSKHFYRVIDGGIRALYGKTGQEAQAILQDAISQLKDDTDENDYWNPTEGNARNALKDLLVFAQLLPHGVFKGD